MLATLVIGLREGLEAALIVGIIAAFLRSNGKSLAGMWLGVALAVLLSIMVGVGLELAQSALPQAEQEALETVIGGVAVFFVTGMIVWMHHHARHLKQQLESEAAHALQRSSTLALASMAFLAVLKEGFETSVFLLATFSVAQSAALAALGALIGLILAVGVGWGIYAGGVRLNLARFFRATAAFLILVAAGLVMSALRTGHEAGWIIAGQQATVNLGWLVAPGTIQSALVTGVLGIPADPRLIEVVGWFAYLVPVALYVYWPQSLRPQGHTAAWLKTGIGAVAAAAALALAIGYPAPRIDVPAQARVRLAANASGPGAATARFVAGSGNAPAALHVGVPGAKAITVMLPDSQRQHGRHAGVEASTWIVRNTTTPAGAPATLSLTQVAAMAGGRLPIGLNPAQHPGPFAATWSVHHATRVWTTHGVLLDAVGRSAAVVSLSGSGLRTPRTVTASNGSLIGAARNWRVANDYVSLVASEVGRVAMAKAQHRLWAVRIPIVLAIVALCLLFSAWRTRTRLRRPSDSDAAADHSTPPTVNGGAPPQPRGARYAAD